MSEDLIYVEIGYDSHISTYGITTSQADQVLLLNDKDEVNEYIITRGQWVPTTCTQEVFFNYVEVEVEELHLQLRDAIDEIKNSGCFY